MIPGDVVRVKGQPRGSAFRVLAIDGDTVECWGGHGGYMAYRSFLASRVGAVVPRRDWPTALLPAEERAEAERRRSEKRTQRKLAAA